jgi:D-alanyl-lipoteichoic acid acyltransferase DltB (MBOAT superfamily)
MVLADNLARIVDITYNNPNESTGPLLVLATVCFAFQIYCDFSGYSDIAIGTAKLFNIQLMRNFAFPYFSQSLSEFWRRWHISLSTWFRDYVFIPLGGSRRSDSRKALNIMVTFLLSGFWHGANWNFIIWGGINGLCILPDALWNEKGKKRRADDVPAGNAFIPELGIICKMGATFIFICLTWIFFRASNVDYAMAILYKIFTECWSASYYIQTIGFLQPKDLVTFSFLGVFLVFEWVQCRSSNLLALKKLPPVARWLVFILLIWVVILIGTFSTSVFLYFRF